MPLTDEQLAAVESIDKHVLVSAGAGSGKTSVLIERFLEVLRKHPESSVHEIIAVTFTRKAAEEMRSRLKESLKRLASSADDENEQNRWQQALCELEAARIGTIHSLCDFILKTHSTEAAVDPGFDLLEDLERAQLIDHSVRQAIATVLEQPASSFEAILELPLEVLAGMLTRLLSSTLKYEDALAVFALDRCESLRDPSPLRWTDLYRNIRIYAEQFVDQVYSNAICKLLQNSQFKAASSYIKDTPRGEKKNLFEKQGEMIALLEQLYKTEGKDPEILEKLSTFTLPRGGGEQAASLREAMKLIKDRCKAFNRMLKPFLNDADNTAIEMIAALIVLAERARHFYEQGKQQHQKLDFDDLISRTTGLVNGSTLERGSLQNLQALLVDEFQDTNNIQATMLGRIASLQGRAKLFLIGDDKQSIYKFQGADVATFNNCKRVISSLNQNREAAEESSGAAWQLEGTGELRSLSMSFRSHPAIVSFINVLFSRLFHSTDNNDEAYRSRFQALKAARPDDGQPRVELVVFDPEGEPDESEEQFNPAASDPENLPLTLVEARTLAEYIGRTYKTKIQVFEKETGGYRDVRFGDYAVLLQANSDFAAVERALADAGIPYISFAGSGFLDRQEILDLENLLKWLSAPQDNHALTAALRSPLFGITDDVIHILRTSGSHSMWFALNSHARSSRDELLLRCTAHLRQWLNQAGTCSVEELLRRIIKLSGIDATLSCAPGGKQQSRNVWKLVHLAASNSQLSLREFLNALQAMRERQVKNLSDAPLTADDAVKIMTIHKSKGLEFGVVLLPRLNRRIHSSPGKLLFGKEFGIAIDPSRDKDDLKPAFFLAADAYNKMLDEEEKKRLLYVALTRARDHLALFMSLSPPRSVSFDKWIREGLELSDLQLADAQTEHSIASGGCGTKVVITQASTRNWQNLAGAEQPDDIPSESSRDLISAPSDNGQLLEMASRVSPDTSLSLVNLTLMRPLVSTSLNYRKVPWQATGRTTPSADAPLVHPTTLGSYFHLLMDRFCLTLRRPVPETMVDLLTHPQVAVYHPELQEQLLLEAEKLLSVFLSSTLCQRIVNASNRIHETGYFILEGGVPQQELRPDLLLEEGTGKWSIIDYKTDDFPANELKKQVKLHQAQLTGYAEAFYRITSCDPQTYVYFARAGLLQEIDCRQPVQLRLI